VVGVQLPERDAAATRARLRRRFPGSVPRDPDSEAQTAIAAMGELLAGQPRHLREISLDLRGITTFDAQVYAAARDIDPGSTRSYGEVATVLGDPTLAREVGRALARNPYPIIVPCHRVLGARGALVGFSAPGGLETKRRLLVIEGAPVASQLALFG
jgi:methylated-DNA-[protein]-cysteine S-methyltransferase